MHRNARTALDSYVIRGGEEGRARLGAVARALAPTTNALLDRVGPIGGGFTIDAGCGGGDVSFLIAERVGPQGHVFGFDLDETKLALARTAAKERGLIQPDLPRRRRAGAMVRNAQLVYARFILTHLANPALLLAAQYRRWRPAASSSPRTSISTAPWDPPCPALQRANELYKTAVRRNGGDPIIGRRLRRLLEEAGLPRVEAALAQPFGREGDAKETARLTFSHIGDAVLAAGLAARDEIGTLQQEIDAFTERSDTTISTPRIFQAWGRKP